MSQITTLNLDDYIQDQHKNNTDMVVRLNDGSIIFVDEQALDKNKMSAEGNPVKNFGVRYRVMSDDMKTVTAQYLIPNEVLNLAKTRGKEFAGIKLPVGTLWNDQTPKFGVWLKLYPNFQQIGTNDRGEIILRDRKDFQPMTRPDPNRPGKRKDTGEYINPKTKEKATLASLMRGVDIEGNPLLAGQNISRFDLGGLRKPFIVNNNKQRLYAKENIEKLKEEGYDSIMFREFEDRSQQILVFPEHINKVVFKYAGGQIKKGGSVVERNPYNYLPRSI